MYAKVAGRSGGWSLRWLVASFWDHEPFLWSVSLGWGLELYSRWLARRSARTSRIVLELADRLARRLPQLADVLVVTGKPRRSSIT